MKHLPTYCQWIVRRFAMQNKKDILVIFRKSGKRTIGRCIAYATKHGHVYYELALNLKRLQCMKPKLVEDLLLHECLHTIIPNHGLVFKQVCKAYKIDKRFWHGRNKTKKSIYMKRK